MYIYIHLHVYLQTCTSIYNANKTHIMQEVVVQKIKHWPYFMRMNYEIKQLDCTNYLTLKLRNHVVILNRKQISSKLRKSQLRNMPNHVPFRGIIFPKVSIVSMAMGDPISIYFGTFQFTNEKFLTLRNMFRNTGIYENAHSHLSTIVQSVTLAQDTSQIDHARGG